MNNLGKKLFATLLAVVCLFASGCEDSPMADKLRRFTGIGMAEPGVVAMVNSVPIYLHQVEALADMNSPVLNRAQAITVEELWGEFADSLYELVIQELTRQELEKRELRVNGEQIAAYESLISSHYGLNPGPGFDEVIRDLGLSPEYWRGQLKAHLEQKLWEQELLKADTVGPEAVEAYLAQHPDLEMFPETYAFFVVDGADKALVEKARTSGKIDPEVLKAEGLVPVRYIRELSALPALWRQDLASLDAGQAAAQIRQNGTGWAYVILEEKFPQRRLTLPEQFALAERGLQSDALPGLYTAWLDEILAHAEIRVASQFRHDNIPVPPPHSTTVLPWERVFDTGEDDEALGEVEGEGEEE